MCALYFLWMVWQAITPISMHRAPATPPGESHEKCVVVEGVGDAVFVQVVSQVVVEAGGDIPVHGLQLDEHQRQAVDEADQVVTVLYA